ncbi:MAG: hypothetical protein L3K15_00145 [Thermoplasmata archaeon]|nr:hypothetical protein [Thermoplasmata archaeon]
MARAIGGARISIDRILDGQGLWVEGRLSEFLRANKFAVEAARAYLRRGTAVIFDGNFYWKRQIEDLIRRLPPRHFDFTLKAPLEVCVERDRRRASPHGARAAAQVYAKTTRFDWGIGIDATRPPDDVVREIVSRLPPRRD